jgi:signal peptidase I
VVMVNSHDMLDTYQFGNRLLLSRVSQYKNGDAIYFRFPSADGSANDFCIQRLIASPGDTIEIKDKQVFVNNKMSDDVEMVRHNYFLNFRRKPDSSYLIREGLWEGGVISGDMDYSFTLGKTQYKKLLSDTTVSSIQIKIEQKYVFNENIFPYNISLGWNTDNFGKLYVPLKGHTVTLDSMNIHLYEKIITLYEKNKLFKSNDSIYINDKYQNKYVFKQDYYFVMGDNRDNAVDSRSFGFLPASFIKGKIIARIKK